MASAGDEPLLHEFAVECREHLEGVEPDLLVLEQQGAAVAPDVVHRLFRAVHSIKGAAGFFGLTAITDLGHVMENVLMKMRDGLLIPDGANVDALLSGADKLRLMLDDVPASESVAWEDERRRLAAVLDGEGAPPTPAAPEVGGARSDGDERVRCAFDGGCLVVEAPGSWGRLAFPVGGPDLEQACRSGGVYVVRVAPDAPETLPDAVRTDLESLGTCLAAVRRPPDAGDPGVAGWHVLFGSVLEADLLGGALGVADEDLLPLDKGDLRSAVAAPRSGDADEPVEPAAPNTAPPPVPPAAPPEPPPARAAAPGPPAAGPAAAARPQETIRVPVDLVDRLMNLAGELVLGRNQLRQELRDLMDATPRLNALVQHVGRFTSEMQESIMRMRMQPVGNVFNRFPRVVRDLGRQLSKEAELVVEGTDVELDKSILEGLSDPLTHLVRNCMDHGLESPEERVRSGKPRAGRLRLQAFHDGGQVHIAVSDDGRGIDPDRVAEKAVARGMARGDEVRAMSDAEKLSLILLPGLSTAEKVSEISGRGVGMDVVKTNIQELGGHLELESRPGEGTTVHVHLPLTLAIIPCLVVGAEEHRFAIPQVNVKELVWVQAADAARRIEKVGSADVLRLREFLLPLVRLADVLDLERTFWDPAAGARQTDRRERLADRRTEDGGGEAAADREDRREPVPDRRQDWRGDFNVVVLRVGTNRFGLVVDELFDNEEIVVKPLSSHVKGCSVFSGATIMGDGRVAMILDAGGIARSANLRFSELEALPRPTGREDAPDRRRVREAVLVFHNAPQEYFALPLSRISRLEKIDPATIQRVGRREYVLHRGATLPLVRLEQVLPVRAPGPDGDEAFLIIPRSEGEPWGIVAHRIFDTLEVDVAVRGDAAEHPAFLGSAAVAGRLTTFLDAGALLAEVGRLPPLPALDGPAGPESPEGPQRVTP